MAKRRKELGDWGDREVVEPEELTPAEVDAAAQAAVLPEVQSAPPAIDGTILPNGMRVVVPRVATGDEPHQHVWARGRRPDNSQVYRCECGLERDR